jgi:hypothetical protein
MNTDKFFNAFEKQSAFNRVAAYVITHPKKPNKRAIINVAYPADGAGTLRVFVKDWFGDYEGKFSMATAGGYGYDKLTAALSRTDGIDGIALYDHSERPRDETTARAVKRVTSIAAKMTKQELDWRAREAKTKPYAKKYGVRVDGVITGLDRLAAMGYVVIQAI